MAIRINTNTMSLNSQRHLGNTQNALSRSLERLSSGLRINHAADDASGLAISEKLRGQISGIQRATMNAQDGISMLQTAEGALEEVSSMLQRMRELAVQAGNGTYSSNDRVEIQKEVEQLKDEISRISSATEFNTKKLLNGDGTALWSASSDKVSAIIRDDVAEGNYKISLSTTPGTNQIFKTDIMDLKDGALGAAITTSGGTANLTNVKDITNPSSMPVTGTSYFTVEISGNGTAGDIASSATTLSYYTQDGSAFTVDTTTVTDSGSRAGYIELEFTSTVSSVTADSTAGTAQVRFIDAKTGTVSDWKTVTISADATDISVDVGQAGVNLQNTAGSTIDTTFDIDITAGGKISSGDKLLFALTPGAIGNDYASSGGGTVTLNSGLTGQTGPTILYDASDTSQNTLSIADDGDSVQDINSVKIYYASMNDSTGNIDLGSFDMNFEEQSNVPGTSGLTSTGAFDLEILGSGDAATSTTKLKDIARFTDADGNNIFDNKQELTLWGNGDSKIIYLEGDDTLSEVETKITDALVALDMGSEDAEVNSHLVDYVTVPDQSGPRAVKGTFIIQTALTGEQGEIAFSGDQALLDGLSLAQIQAATNNSTTVNVRDAHTGQLIGTDTTGDDSIYGLIEGVEVVVDPRAGITESWDNAKGEINFAEDTDASSKTHFLHLVDNSTDLQIGANEGQTLSVSIPQLDIKGLGVENIWLVSQELAQKAIPDIDRAISKVVTIRATIGAQINRLEHTINGLQVASENMTASESRIRDLDVAAEMAKFTRSQILNQSGLAMLSQANQIPQMALTLLQG